MTSGNKKTSLHVVLFLVIIFTSLVFHWRIFSTDLIGVHVWRQSQTQINIQNFYRHDFNIMNPRSNAIDGVSNIRRFEFPLMQWIIASFYKVFGESIVITRISMFVIGLLGLFGFYSLANAIWKNRLIAAMGTWAFSFSPLFYYYTMNPLPDLFALSSSIWAVNFSIRFFITSKIKFLVFSLFFLSLATLAKLPFVIFGLPIFVFSLQQLYNNKIKAIPQFFLISVLSFLLLLPAFLWYKWVIPTWGDNGVIKGVFDNKVSFQKTIEIFNFHLTEFLPKILVSYACFPFFLTGLFFMFFRKTYRNFLWLPLSACGIAALTYYLFEYNMIEIIHDYYMLPFQLPLFLVITYGIKILFGLNRIIQIFSVLFILAAPYFAFSSVHNYWSLKKSYFNPDVFLHRTDLRKAVPNDKKCIILNDVSGFIFSYQVDKQGAMFSDDNLPPLWVKDLVNKGFTHMYSDSRKVDDDPLIRQYIDTMIMERGSVKVFKLKID